MGAAIEEITRQLVQLGGRDGARGDEHAVDALVVEDGGEPADRSQPRDHVVGLLTRLPDVADGAVAKLGLGQDQVDQLGALVVGSDDHERAHVPAAGPLDLQPVREDAALDRHEGEEGQATEQPRRRRAGVGEEAIGEVAGQRQDHRHPCEQGQLDGAELADTRGEQVLRREQAERRDHQGGGSRADPPVEGRPRDREDDDPGGQGGDRVAGDEAPAQRRAGVLPAGFRARGGAPAGEPARSRRVPPDARRRCRTWAPGRRARARSPGPRCAPSSTVVWSESFAGRPPTIPL